MFKLTKSKVPEQPFVQMLVRPASRCHGRFNLQGHSQFVKLLYGQHLAFSLVGHNTVAINEKLFIAERGAKPNFSCVKVAGDGGAGQQTIDIWAAPLK